MTWACVVIWPMDDLESSGSLEGNCILCAVSTFLKKKNLKSLLYTKMLAISACNMLLTQGHFASLRSLEKKVYKVFLLYTFLLEKHWKLLLRMKISFDLSHNLDPKSLGQVQCHCSKIHYSCLCKIL